MDTVIYRYRGKCMRCGHEISFVSVYSGRYCVQCDYAEGRRPKVEQKEFEWSISAEKEAEKAKKDIKQ